MTYAQGNTASRNTTTLALVAGIHAVAIYGIVTGLAGPIFGPKPADPLAGYQIDNASKPDDPVKPLDKPRERITDKVIFTDPVRPIGGDPLTPFGLGGSAGTLGEGGGLGEVEFPQVETPRPLPSFTAKAPRPRGNASNWVTQADYPTREINLGHEGLTRVRLSISPNGKVSGCEVTASSGWAALDAATCNRISAKGKFDPATDTSGEAASGTYNTSVKWQLPE
ncbi:MAG: TonB family protein [Novosphingobium sp.]